MTVLLGLLSTVALAFIPTSIANTRRQVRRKRGSHTRVCRENVGQRGKADMHLTRAGEKVAWRSSASSRNINWKKKWSKQGGSWGKDVLLEISIQIDVISYDLDQTEMPRPA